MNPGGHPAPAPTRKEVERVAGKLEAIASVYPELLDGIATGGRFLLALLDRAEKAEAKRDEEAEKLRLARLHIEEKCAVRDAALAQVAELRGALDNSQSLLVSMLLEPRPKKEIEAQVIENRAILALADQEPKS